MAPAERGGRAHSRAARRAICTASLPRAHLTSLTLPLRRRRFKGAHAITKDVRQSHCRVRALPCRAERRVHESILHFRASLIL
jgi:hypothetical protein